MTTRKRIPTDGGPSAWTQPFAGLAQRTSASPPPSANQPPSPLPTQPAPAIPSHRGRVDLLRQTAHRGGKTVTVITGFIGIGDDEKRTLAKAIQAACGCGGTVKDGRIEIQGDHRDTAARVLREAGFFPVRAGG